jgi:hypothetical protein
VRRPISCAIAKSGGTPKASQPSPMAGTLFSVVLLLTPHSADAAQHAGLFVEPNMLAGAASACQTLYDRSWRKAAIELYSKGGSILPLVCRSYPKLAHDGSDRRVVVAIPTKRNSLVVSIIRKAAKCRNGPCTDCGISRLPS